MSSVSNSLDRLAVALSDRYTIERELGRGGMAKFVLAVVKLNLAVLKFDLAVPTSSRDFPAVHDVWRRVRQAGDISPEGPEREVKLFKSLS